MAVRYQVGKRNAEGARRDHQRPTGVAFVTKPKSASHEETLSPPEASTPKRNSSRSIFRARSARPHIIDGGHILRFRRRTFLRQGASRIAAAADEIGDKLGDFYQLVGRIRFAIDDAPATKRRKVR